MAEIYLSNKLILDLKSEATKKTSIANFLNMEMPLSLVPVSESLYDLYDFQSKTKLEIKAFQAKSKPVLDLKKIAQSVGQNIQIGFFEYDKSTFECHNLYIFANPENLWTYLKVTDALAGYSTTSEPQEFLDIIKERPKLQLHAHMCVHLYKTSSLYPHLVTTIKIG